jgi:hypothetical protein
LATVVLQEVMIAMKSTFPGVIPQPLTRHRQRKDPSVRYLTRLWQIDLYETSDFTIHDQQWLHAKDYKWVAKAKVLPN